MQEIDASTFHNILYQYIYFVQFSSIPGACMCGASFFPPLGIVFDPYTQQLITEVRDGYVFLTILLTLQPLHPFPEYVCRRQPARMRSSLYIYIYTYTRDTILECTGGLHGTWRVGDSRFHPHGQTSPLTSTPLVTVPRRIV